MSEHYKSLITDEEVIESLIRDSKAREGTLPTESSRIRPNLNFFQRTVNRLVSNNTRIDKRQEEFRSENTSENSVFENRNFKKSKSKLWFDKINFIKSYINENSTNTEDRGKSDQREKNIVYLNDSSISEHSSDLNSSKSSIRNGTSDDIIISSNESFPKKDRKDNKFYRDFYKNQTRELDSVGSNLNHDKSIDLNHDKLIDVDSSSDSDSSDSFTTKENQFYNKFYRKLKRKKVIENRVKRSKKDLEAIHSSLESISDGNLETSRHRKKSRHRRKHRRHRHRSYTPPHISNKGIVSSDEHLRSSNALIISSKDKKYSSYESGEIFSSNESGCNSKRKKQKTDVEILSSSTEKICVSDEHISSDEPILVSNKSKGKKRNGVEIITSSTEKISVSNEKISENGQKSSSNGQISSSSGQISSSREPIISSNEPIISSNESGENIINLNRPVTSLHEHISSSNEQIISSSDSVCSSKSIINIPSSSSDSSVKIVKVKRLKKKKKNK